MSVGERDYRLTCLTYGSQPAAHVTWWVDGVQMPHQSYVTEVTLRSCFRAALLFQKKEADETHLWLWVRWDKPLWWGAFPICRLAKVGRATWRIALWPSGLKWSTTESGSPAKPRINWSETQQSVTTWSLTFYVSFRELKFFLKHLSFFLGGGEFMFKYLSNKYFKRCIWRLDESCWWI